MMDIQLKILITTLVLMLTTQIVADTFRRIRDRLFYIFLILVGSLPIQFLVWVWLQ